MKHLKNFCALFMTICLLYSLILNVLAYNNNLVSDATDNCIENSSYTVFNPPDLTEDEIELICKYVLGEESIPQDGSFV